LGATELELSGEGARIAATNVPTKVGIGKSNPQPTRGSGGASWAPPAASAAEPRSPTHFCQAYRTLLDRENSYWIKQALRHKKASFFLFFFC